MSGLHVQFMMDANYLDEAPPYSEGWRLPIVVDYMGNIDTALGVDQAGFQLMRRLLEEGRLWVKVSGAYRGAAQKNSRRESGVALRGEK